MHRFEERRRAGGEEEREARQTERQREARRSEGTERDRQRAMEHGRRDGDVCRRAVPPQDTPSRRLWADLRDRPPKRCGGDGKWHVMDEDREPPRADDVLPIVLPWPSEPDTR